MTSKGFTARVNYDKRDNIFLAHIIGTRSAINFHGGSAAELRAAFELAVEDCLDDCEGRGL
jgi:predicted HicB family RNase H-like nuclease